MQNLDRYKKELQSLLETSDMMKHDLELRVKGDSKVIEKLEGKKKETYDKINGSFESHYQGWYTESIAVVRQIIPDRLDEFINLYETDLKRKSVDTVSYSIQDWMNGRRSALNRYGVKHIDDIGVVTMKFGIQIAILNSAQKRFTSSLFDIKQVVQADLFDSEIEAANELSKKGFYRASGIICGVVLEKHLLQACENHQLSNRKKNPTISDLNDLLKNNGVIEVSIWRFIQHLGDVRNKCGHNKEDEPTSDEVKGMIEGVSKIIKTVF